MKLIANIFLFFMCFWTIPMYWTERPERDYLTLKVIECGVLFLVSMKLDEMYGTSSKNTKP